MKELIVYLYQRKIFILTCIDYFGSMFHELLYLFIKFESSNKSIIYLSITKTEYLLQLYMIREILLDGKFYKKKCFSISKIAPYLVGYPILLHKNEVFHQGVSQSMWQNPDETGFGQIYLCRPLNTPSLHAYELISPCDCLQISIDHFWRCRSYLICVITN